MKIDTAWVSFLLIFTLAGCAVDGTFKEPRLSLELEYEVSNLDEIGSALETVAKRHELNFHSNDYLETSPGNQFTNRLFEMRKSNKNDNLTILVGTSPFIGESQRESVRVDIYDDKPFEPERKISKIIEDIENAVELKWTPAVRE